MKKFDARKTVCFNIHGAIPTSLMGLLKFQQCGAQMILQKLLLVLTFIETGKPSLVRNYQ